MTDTDGDWLYQLDVIAPVTVAVSLPPSIPKTILSVDPV